MLATIPRAVLEKIAAWLVKGRYGKIELDVADGQIVNIRFTESVRVRDLN